MAGYSLVTGPWPVTDWLLDHGRLLTGYWIMAGYSLVTAVMAGYSLVTAVMAGYCRYGWLLPAWLVTGVMAGYWPSWLVPVYMALYGPVYP